jgi:Protein of unknown function (DUF2946)
MKLDRNHRIGMVLKGLQSHRRRSWTWLALLALLVNVLSPVPMLRQASAALPGFAVEDGFVCSAHSGSLPDAPAKTQTKDCECSFCCLQDDGRAYLPEQSGAASEPSHCLVATLPDLVLGVASLNRGLANRARAPPQSLPMA